MPSLSQRIATAAQDALTQTRSVSPLDVLCMIGWVTQNHVDRWRQGRVDHLEPLLQTRTESWSRFWTPYAAGPVSAAGLSRPRRLT